MPLVTRFVGVDADAVKGTSLDSCQTIDTALQRRIQHNHEDLLAPRVGICWSPIIGSANNFTSDEGIRPYCALQWHTIWTGEMLVHQDQTHIELTFAYHADTLGSAGTSAGAVEIGVQCGDGTDTTSSPTTLAVTYAGGITTGHQTILVELAERVRQTRVMWIRIMERSTSTIAVVTTIGSGGNGQTATLYHESPYRLRDSAVTATPGFFDPNSGGAPPDGGSLEGMYLWPGTHATWVAAAAQKLDLLYTADNGIEGTIAGTLQEVVGSAAAIQTSGQMYRHAVFMLRALFIAPVFRSITSPVAASAIQPRAKFAPIQEFGASEAQTQASDVVRAYLQPSIALVGPRGRVGDVNFTTSDLDRFAANGYAAHWPTILADFDNVTSGEHRDLVNDGLYLRTENPDLEIRCSWISVQHGAPWNRKQIEKPTQKKYADEKIDKLDVTDVSGPGSATWTLTASLEQLTDAVSGVGVWATDIDTYGSIASEPVVIPVYGADVRNAASSQPPVLRGIDSMEQTGKSDVTDPGFWFKEGSLFPADGDLDVIHRTTHNIRVSGTAQAQTLRPFRFKLSMNLDAFTNPVKLGDSALTLEARLRLTLVSITVIERPRRP